MARLIIHIGTHKTATTFLQHRLAHARPWLAERGFIYPDFGSPAHHLLVAHWVGLKRELAWCPDPTAVWKALAAEHVGSDRTIVLSSEEFSRATANRPDFKTIRNWFEGFESVRLICYVRDQLSYLQSIYTEVSKAMNPAAPAAMVDEAIRTGMFTGVALGYKLLADILVQQVPQEDVNFYNYHDACEGEGGILAHFLRQLGLKKEPPTTRVQRQNESRAAAAVWIANMISIPEVAPALLIDQVAQVLAEQFPSLHGATIFTREEIARLQDRFGPVNRYFEARVQRLDPRFQMPELQNFSDRLTRDEIGPDVWDAVKAVTCRAALPV